MDPRVAALVDRVREAAQQNLGAMLSVQRLANLDADHALRRIGDTPPFPSGTRYELWLYPAIYRIDVLPNCPALEFTFVVFRPTSDIAFLDKARDLAPSSDRMTWILDQVTKDLTTRWPHRTFSFQAVASSEDHELCFVFADVASFKQIVVDAGRDD